MAGLLLARASEIVSVSGTFVTPLRCEKLYSSHSNGRPQWILLSILVYKSQLHDADLVVPAAFVTDFASVPRLPFAYVLTGDTGHASATLHDYLVRERVVSRTKADKIFREALIAEGEPKWRAWAMYVAVSSNTLLKKVLRRE
jgi:hypothetical protein